ncbi:MAG: SHOCT-like domain-containing protein [Betaproteobacteria bacterium]
MSDESRRILDLLAQGKITADEAERLLKIAGNGASAARGVEAKPRIPAKVLRIAIHKAANDWQREKDVTIRVPLAMVRSGVRLGALIPGTGERIAQALRERGIDFDLNHLDSSKLEAMLSEMGEMTLDVDQGRAQVRISCE